jgi:hypothetical protein
MNKQNARRSDVDRPPFLLLLSCPLVGKHEDVYYKPVHQLPPTNEVKHGTPIDRSCGVIFARRWGLGILSLAQELAPASRSGSTQMARMRGMDMLSGIDKPPARAFRSSRIWDPVSTPPAAFRRLALQPQQQLAAHDQSVPLPGPNNRPQQLSQSLKNPD